MNMGVADSVSYCEHLNIGRKRKNGEAGVVGEVGDIGGRCIILPPTVDDIRSQKRRE